MTDDLQSLYAERDRVRAILDAEQSLHSFVKLMWGQIEGNKPFIDGWHLQAICEHLEACIRGEIRTLLINCPPRLTKTSLVSIMLVGWTWLERPWAKFLYSSYAQVISWEHSRLCKMLIQSPLYQENWGHLFQLSSDQSTKGHFTNTAHGHRIATSIGGATTALGGDVLVCLPYNSVINTDFGQIEIGYIVENKLNVSVWSYNHESGQIELDNITEYEKNPGKQLIEIELDDRVIEVTEDHPVWVEGKGYIAASLIEAGDELLVLAS